MAESQFVKSLNEDDKKQYLAKLKLTNGVLLPDPYLLTEGWSDDIKRLPSLSWRDVTSYLLDTPSPFTNQSLKAYKSLDAFNYFICGHVQECFLHDVRDKEEFCFVKSKVSYPLFILNRHCRPRPTISNYNYIYIIYMANVHIMI